MPRAAERIKLTETVVKALEAPSRDEVAKLYRDSILVGFACRVAYGGTKAFVLNYTTKAGRERRYTIGQWPAWKVEGAREHAKELRRLVDMGGDPLAEDQEIRHALTFGELVEDFKQRHVTKSGRRLRDGHKDLNVLALDAVPIWSHRPAASITRAEIRKLVEAKAEQAPAGANKLLEVICRVYNFAIDRELLTDNPARRLKRPAPKTQKDRALNEREVKVLWEGLDGPKSTAADVLKLILLTGQRPGECCEVEWSEIELDTALWSLPASKAKNGLAHKIPLSATALEIIKSQPHKGRYVFHGRLRESIYHDEPARLLRENEYFGLPALSAHDLRRSAATNMARIGVPRLVVKKILNHIETRDTTAIYERYGYIKEQREALERWERELLSILGKAKKADVVEIAR